MRLYLIARHGESTLNVEERVNGDPSIPCGLTEQGRANALALGEQVANVAIGLCVHTRFLRTRQTAELALAGRDVPFEEEPLLDDIDVGELEGKTIHEYRAWKREHTRADPFPGGESIFDAARRYATGFRNLVNCRAPGAVLVVCHEIPLRYVLNAATASGDLDQPMHDIRNATPYVFDDGSLRAAAERIEQLAR